MLFFSCVSICWCSLFVKYCILRVRVLHVRAVLFLLFRGYGSWLLLFLLFSFYLGGFMAFRKSMRRGRSRKIFRRGAQRVHPKNRMFSSPMRGGIRL